MDAKDVFKRHLNLNDDSFEKAPMTDKERLNLQEECILEMAELISEIAGGNEE